MILRYFGNLNKGARKLPISDSCSKRDRDIKDGGLPMGKQGFACVT